MRRLRRRIEGAFALAFLNLLAVHATAQPRAPKSPPKESPSSEARPTESQPTESRSTESPSKDAAAGGAGRSARAPLLDAFLAQVQTLTADFTQEIRSADGQLVETASGSVALARPNHFRWIYEKPYRQEIVADGENLWIYDVELQQVTRAPLDDTVASSPAMLLSGDKAVREGFDVVETFERDGLSWVRLEPHLPGTDFSSVLIAFDGKSPRRLELEDTLNQVTRIDLSNVALNPKLKDRLFEFKPPRGADVIGGN
ncbi:MAG TPA: outer membrane lipoprotein chaperone LolA [Gammaproteobacteria bacterium]|nr:outer membrane lipoprotein chaperone LolA [Gammaproteobacteria bacterium]